LEPSSIGAGYAIDEKDEEDDGNDDDDEDDSAITMCYT